MSNVQYPCEPTRGWRIPRRRRSLLGPRFVRKIIIKTKRQLRIARLQFLQGSAERAGRNKGRSNGVGRDSNNHPVVEGAYQGSMVRLYSRVARLGAGRLRLHRVLADHGANRQGVRCTADRCRDRLYPDVVDAACRRGRLGLARRSDRPQDTADDFDRLVFGVQLHRRLFPDLLVSAAVSDPVGHRHGGGMAGWRGAGNGDLAAALSWLYEWGFARVVGSRLSAVEWRLLVVVRPIRLARHAVDRHLAGIGDRLCSLLCQRAADLG